jgi:hypothetical protein
VIFLVTGVSFAQQATFKGTVKDTENNPLQYVNVFLEQDGKTMNLATTDAKGEYQMPGVVPGNYTLKAVGMIPCAKTVIKENVAISSGDVKFVEFEINCAGMLEVVTVKTEKPVFESKKTTSSVEISGKDVAKLPGRNINSALASMEGVTSTNGKITSVRGNRSDGHKTFIDGMPVRGTSGFSMSALESLELIQGGVPAEYGDGTSFTVITTRGIPNIYTGSFELRGSVEGYNNFLAAAFITGPLLKGKGPLDPARIGFMLSAEAGFNQDAAPAHGGTWMVKDDVLERIQKNPVLYNNPLDIAVNRPAAEYLHEDDFVKRRTRKNAYDWNYLLQAKIDFLAGKGKIKPIRISLGGSYEFIKQKNWSQGTSLLNYAQHGETQASTLRLNARMSHRVFSNFSDSSILKNVMYDLSVNYTFYDLLTQDAKHKDNFFNYGYIGKFETHRKPFYSYQEKYAVVDSMQNTTHIYYGMIVMDNMYDSITFTPGTLNPHLTQYTQNFYETFTPEVLRDYYGGPIRYDRNMYGIFGALLNGESPNSVYGLYSIPGMGTASALDAGNYYPYSKTQSTTVGARANLFLTLGNHEIKLGFQLDRVSVRGYSINPSELWGLMRNLQNSHMQQLDYGNLMIVRDTIKFPQLVNADLQSNFDRNVRNALKVDLQGKDQFWLDIDNYDPEFFNLNMFSADELLLGTSAGARQMVNYYGYDHTGKKYKGKSSVADFFAVNDQGVHEYRVGTYEPVYMSFYLQDQFTIQNLRFAVGLRIDRFDANQDVLKDPFLFREGMTIKDLREGKTIGENKFAGYGDEYMRNNRNHLLYDENNPNRYDDYVIYVDGKDKAIIGGDVLSPENIVAYRRGLQWYNAQGQEILDPDRLVGATGGPLLFTAPESGNKVSTDAFTDYTPQWSYMPRLSFSFPVSDNSLFTAHYDIMTNRPPGLQINPIQYHFIESLGSNPNNVFTNPSLIPQKSIDYEIGFRQKVGDNSAIGIAAYYSEKRDQVQMYRYTGAYPTTYYSYANIDFGTVQGFSFSYTYRNNTNLSLRASYTIQFAKGTGSDATSQASIVQSGQPNLRTLTNLEFDQRHRMSAFIDYRFGAGEGPKTEKVGKDGKRKDIHWLENTGFTVVFSGGSGLPYSRSIEPYSTYITGQKARYVGAMNGSFKPWTFQCDLRIDKAFPLKMNKNAKDKEGNQKKQRDAMLVLYLDVQNIFNIKNTLRVYEYTGNANDDGYLTATRFAQQIASQTDVASFRNYYSMRVNDPYNYGLPARVNIGIQFSF